MNIRPFRNGISEEDRKDIVELHEKISNFKEGNIDEERFKLFRLTRGVYGQRQLGVQMFRIKIPFGRLTTAQLIRIADISDKYATGNLHITTRQDIQLHFVKLDDTPEIWRELAEKQITAREACGNTVRNVTASATAGIDPEEPFDVSPHAFATAHFFMRNPVCQEMGRKIKPAFSSGESDTAMTFMHDFGFIPRIRGGSRGFKVVVGGGLGAQAMFAQTAYEFLEEDRIIPFMEAALRIFDRYGERERRHKARLKFLIKKLGLDDFLELVEQEKEALSSLSVPIDPINLSTSGPVAFFEPEIIQVPLAKKYESWLRTNTFEQKQKGYYGVFIKVYLGDLNSEKARYLAQIADKYAADDIRLTINQNVLLKFVHAQHLPELFTVLDGYGLAEPGYDSIGDITACPGTDTCNLAVTNSTGLAGRLEALVREEYPELIDEHHIKIKISGCMNACGQHMIANIGFHGSSIKKNDWVIPAMQVVIGGGINPNGQPAIADKVIKLPTKKIPDCLRIILDDFQANSLEHEYFNDYYTRKGGKKFYYDLLKPLADISSLSDRDRMDWGQDHAYKQAIGVGECAGVVMDLVGSIIKDATEKLEKAQQCYRDEIYPDGVYYAYSALVVGAKALLLSEDIKCNTHRKIISDFQETFITTGKLVVDFDYEDTVLSSNLNKPSPAFAREYISKAERFLSRVVLFYDGKSNNNGIDRPVIGAYYKA